MNEKLPIIITALIPVGLLFFYINRKDKMSPEPAGQLIKAFFFGVLSVFVSFTMSIPFNIIGLYSSENLTVLDSVRISFFGAAIPEEIAKFIMLWLLLRKNPYFDEKMDGIVYAVCVSLGFAALENIMYLFNNQEEYLQVGIMRGLFSIPGHFCFGVLMGYYYSLAKFYPKTHLKNKLMVILAPVLAHGIYDSILFVIDLPLSISGILMIVFLFFCHRMWKYSSRKIKEHLERDSYNS